MKLFYRYIIKEIGIIFIIGCAFFLFLLTMEDCFGLFKFGFGLKTMKAFLLLIGATLGFALPMALLFSLIMGFLRLSSSNAIIILQSSGISMRGIITYIIIFSIFLSILGQAINGNIAPKSLFYLSRMQDELTKDNNILKERTFTKIGGREIYVDRIKDGHLMDIYITEGEYERIIFAKKGRLIDTLLLLEDGQIQEQDKDDIKMYHIMKFSSLSIPFGEQRDWQRTSIEHLTLSELKKNKKNPYIKTELHKRLSISYAPLFLCLIAIPLGIRQRKQERVFGLGASTIIILLYYLMFLPLEGFSKHGAISPFSLWIPNIVFGVGGALMLRRFFR